MVVITRPWGMLMINARVESNARMLVAPLALARSTLSASWPISAGVTSMPRSSARALACLEKATEKLSAAGAVLWISRWSMVPKLPASLRRTGCTCSTRPSRSIGMIGVIRSAICSSSFPLRRRGYPSAFSSVSSSAPPSSVSGGVASPSPGPSGLSTLSPSPGFSVSSPSSGFFAGSLPTAMIWLSR